MIKERNIHIIVLFTAVLLCTCSPKTVQNSEATLSDDLKGAPEWISKGCSSYWDDYERKNVICGVGSKRGTTNPSIARESAIARARGNLASKLKIRVNTIIKDYQASSSSGLNTVDQEDIKIINNQMSDTNLVHSELVDTWISPVGTYYALVALDVQHFKGTVNKMSTLPEPVQKAIIEDIDKDLTQ